MTSRILKIAALLSLFAACGGEGKTRTTPALPLAPSPVPDPPPAPPPDPPPPVPGVPTITFVGAGDIGWCGLEGARLTGNLLGRLLSGPDAWAFALGDNAYPDGSLAEYRNCFDPFWGPYRDRMFPTPGNHEYHMPNAKGYFDYFGPRAGPDDRGYYSVQLGAWRIFSLNSEIAHEPRGQAQLAWLASELRAYALPGLCQMAFWHRPLTSSGSNGDYPPVQGLWNLLGEHGVEAVLNGHDHIYERFAPDPRGLRQFTVGTGGGSLTGVRNRRASEALITEQYGLLALTLADGHYEWKFVGVDGKVLDSSGSKISCR